jgi:hypothetical protein
MHSIRFLTFMLFLVSLILSCQSQKTLPSKIDSELSLTRSVNLACLYNEYECALFRQPKQFDAKTWSKRMSELVRWQHKWQSMITKVLSLHRLSQTTKKGHTAAFINDPLIDPLTDQFFQEALDKYPEIHDIIVDRLLTWHQSHKRYDLLLEYAHYWLTQKQATTTSDQTHLIKRLLLIISSYSEDCTLLKQSLSQLYQTSIDKVYTTVSFNPDQIKLSIRLLKYCTTQVTDYQKSLPRLQATYDLLVKEKPSIKDLQASEMSSQSILKYALELEKNRKVQQAIHILGLIKEQMNDQEINEKESATQSTQSTSIIDQIRLAHARIYIQRIRTHYKEVIADLILLKKSPHVKQNQVLMLLAKAYAKIKQQEEMDDSYQTLIKQFPQHPDVLKAKFFSAFAHYEAHRYTQAHQALKSLTRHQGKRSVVRTLKGRSTQKWIAAAEWYYSWCLFLSLAPNHKKQSNMADFFIYQIGQGLPQSEAGRRAAYWAFIALTKHKPKKAQLFKQQLIDGATQDWYALLLRSQYSHEIKDIESWQNSKIIKDLKKQKQIHQSDEQINPNLAILLQQRSSQDLLKWQRIQMLHILYQDTTQFAGKMNQVQEELIRDFDDHQAWQWVESTFAYYAGIRKSLKSHAHRLKKAPAKHDQEWWYLAYPAGFWHQVQTASKTFKFPASYLWSFIRKESAFQPQVSSKAHALGLMQLLHKTAVSLTKTSNSPFNDQNFDLFKVHDNIQLGSFYLHQLAQRYHNQLPLIAAAYNAGPKSLNQWIEYAQKHKYHRLDYFVELIPFKEARNYVKRLQASACIYALLYEDQSLNHCAQNLPWHLNFKIVEGVTF